MTRQYIFVTVMTIKRINPAKSCVSKYFSNCQTMGHLGSLKHSDLTLKERNLVSCLGEVVAVFQIREGSQVNKPEKASHLTPQVNELWET